MYSLRGPDLSGNHTGESMDNQQEHRFDIGLVAGCTCGWQSKQIQRGERAEANAKAVAEFFAHREECGAPDFLRDLLSGRL